MHLLAFINWLAPTGNLVIVMKFLTLLFLIRNRIFYKKCHNLLQKWHYDNESSRVHKQKFRWVDEKSKNIFSSGWFVICHANQLMMQGRVWLVFSKLKYYVQNTKILIELKVKYQWGNIDKIQLTKFWTKNFDLDSFRRSNRTTISISVRRWSI